MSRPVLTDGRQVTADWLTETLTRSGALRSGRITACAVETGDSDWARFALLRPAYSDDATGVLPSVLRLKMCAGDASPFDDSEVRYYAQDYVGLPDAPLVPCHDARYDPAARAYHLLLTDLSETHRNNWRTAPTLEYGLALADALASLHAHQWGRDPHGVPLALPDDCALSRYLDHIRPGLEPMLAALGDDLPAEARRTLETVFARCPDRLRERLADPCGFTLVHGDVNPGNVLSPKQGAGRTYLLDRQPFDWSLTVWPGVSDLAYAMVPWWESEARRAWEVPILRAYHAALMRRGVSDYAWAALWRDYRLTAVQSLYVAVEWCVLEEDRTRMRWVWEPQLRNALTAFASLNCAELL